LGLKNKKTKEIYDFKSAKFKICVIFIQILFITAVSMEINQSKNLLFDKTLMDAAVLSVAQSIISEYPARDISSLAFIGIQTRGVPFARRIIKAIHEVTSEKAELGTLDISMYRDDIGMRKTLPLIHETLIPFDINGRTIILADDVLYTGRSIRAALDALTDYGRPSFIRLAVLIDRGLREFPIRADYIGKTCILPTDKTIRVEWEDSDSEDAVYECEKNHNELIK
jgi:pyrimidine operon attenuation protein/uracil phosphoribosyltransferase